MHRASAFPFNGSECHPWYRKNVPNEYLLSHWFCYFMLSDNISVFISPWVKQNPDHYFKESWRALWYLIQKFLEEWEFSESTYLLWSSVTKEGSDKLLSFFILTVSIWKYKSHDYIEFCLFRYVKSYKTVRLKKAQLGLCGNQWQKLQLIIKDVKIVPKCFGVWPQKIWIWFTPWSFCSDSHDLHHTGTLQCFGSYFGCCDFSSVNMKCYGFMVLWSADNYSV